MQFNFTHYKLIATQSHDTQQGIDRAAELSKNIELKLAKAGELRESLIAAKTEKLRQRIAKMVDTKRNYLEGIEDENRSKLTGIKERINNADIKRQKKLSNIVKKVF